MPWFNVDDGFANSKPVLRIPRRYRCAAIGLWTMAGSWSAKELTDGFIPDNAIEEFAGTQALAEWLVKAGLWRRVEGGWQFEGWAKWQKTKDKVLAYREREAEKKRGQRSGTKTAGSASVSPGDSRGTELSVPEGQLRESPMCPAQPLPTPLPTPKPLSVETSGGGVTSVDAEFTEPPRFCPDHPNDTTESCLPCKKARTAHKAWMDAAPAREARRVEAAQLRQRNCPRCQGTNTYEDEHGGVHPCRPHLEAANA